MTSLLPALALGLLAGAQSPAAPDQEPYDPLALPEKFEPEHLDCSFRDGSRDRELPLRIHLPASSDPAPVVLFSHGLGGSRAGSTFLGQHWSGRGYVAVFLQHPGSDESVWKDQPKLKAWGALRKAASKENMLLRIHDVPTVLDQLALWNAEEEHPLQGRLDLERVGMSGHSFGAVTTQAVSGQAVGRRGPIFFDERIDAALVLSPSAALGQDSDKAFGSVTIPWMLMTGTEDSAPVGKQSIASRLEVYPYLPAKVPHYELVLWKAQHSAFSDRSLPGQKSKRNPNHHRAILALSTAFFDHHLSADPSDEPSDEPSAGVWLHGEAGRAALESKDRWQFGPSTRVEER
ncbi:MAG: putative dienelactone hydrolase [Planctomycetota bacterium]|jgi:predicted dienelactone hydrolase